jgi:hypothetical protein
MPWPLPYAKGVSRFVYFEIACKGRLKDVSTLTLYILLDASILNRNHEIERNFRSSSCIPKKMI